ncbi:MAG: GNAT family N-acetyltransferase [Solirubrobacterales bacterium]|nr:GNAT family N-acetyltransferase [Solirubrobacterales bacterium]MBV9838464.1 GNAT family N-acetyltransferase [Solirubrobacterales bacterium]
MNGRALERLETPRLICERTRPEHATELSRLLLDPEIARWLSPSPDPPTQSQLAERLVASNHHWERYGFGMWLLRDRASAEMVGRGGLQWTFVAQLRAVEAGWAIMPDRWGEGLATELAQAAVEVAQRDLQLAEIIAYTRPDNLASRRVMEKSGFVYEREFNHFGRKHLLYRRALGELWRFGSAPPN